MENRFRELTVSPQATHIAEIGSLVSAVEAERAGRQVAAWQEALKAIALRPFHPEEYVQMAMRRHGGRRFGSSPSCRPTSAGSHVEVAHSAAGGYSLGTHSQRPP